MKVQTYFRQECGNTIPTCLSWFHFIQAKLEISIYLSWEKHKGSKYKSVLTKLLVSYCYQIKRIINSLCIIGSLQDFFFFQQVHYSGSLVPGQLSNFAMSTPLS